MLTLRHITKSFDNGVNQTHVLKDLSFDATKGEFISIVGESGSGKTTLLNIIGLIDQQTNGQYLLDRIDVSSLQNDRKAGLRNQQIGFIFQSFYLLPQLSAWQNVALPLYYRRVSTTSAKFSAINLLDRMGLSKFTHHMPSELSGGQRQRVAIARALVGKPGMILADEPTASLDHTNAKEVMNLLQTVNEELGSLVIIITHDRDIARNCSRQIVLEHGKILSDLKTERRRPSNYHTMG